MQTKSKTKALMNIMLLSMCTDVPSLNILIYLSNFIVFSLLEVLARHFRINIAHVLEVRKRAQMTCKTLSFPELSVCMYPA